MRAALPAQSKVVGKPVDYAGPGVTLKGYLAHDEAATGKRPAVLVVHEWWGLNEYARKRARMLAEQGYVALAVDMYGVVKAKVRVINGADDPFVKKEAIEALQAEMAAAKVDFRFANLPGAAHGFTNPDADELGKKFKLPLAYSAEADKRSWSEASAFLSAVLK